MDATNQFHKGHAFSCAMPEIRAVNGMPLADLLHPKPYSDDDFEAALRELKDEHIEIRDELSDFLPNDMSVGNYLAESFDNFLMSLE